MRALVFAWGVSALAIATPVSAQDVGPYLGIEGGVAFPGDFTSDIDGNRDASETSLDMGWEVAGQLGYDWGWVRTEIEASHRRFDVEEVDFTAPNFLVIQVAPGPVRFGLDGDIRLTSLMGNILFDIAGGDDGGLGFSLGAGAGRTWMGIDAVPTGTGPASIDDSDSEWAWQGIAQLRVPVSDRASLSVKYRYFSTLEFDVQDSFGDSEEFELRSHSALLGVVFALGRRAEPPARPPERAVAPAPRPPIVVERPRPVPAPSCNTGPYIVFFDWDSAALTPEARTVLDVALSAYRNCGRAQLMIAGHADRSGSYAYNMALSQRRNDAVVAYLTNAGMPRDMIATEAFSEGQPRIPTADGVREAQNRRVELTFGPGSGN